MKLAFFEVYDWEIPILKKRFAKHKLLFYKTPLDKSHLKDIADCDIISVFIYSKVDSSIIDCLPKLKLVVTRSTGYDHIDCKYAKAKKVLVCNIPYYGENTVAEHAFALLLSLSRKIHKSYMKIMADDFSIEELQGFDLKGKTIGVLGTGHIGSHLIRMANGFEMNVLAYDHHKKPELQKKLNFKYVSLQELLKRSDIISLHLPLTSDTKHIINSKNLKLMKHSAVIINTARGELIDTKALLNALNSEHIAGAGLDVIEGEKLIQNEHEILRSKHHTKAFKQLVEDLNLIRNEKVVFTPHIAFYSQEALMRILSTTMEEIEMFIKNKPLNVVK